MGSGMLLFERTLEDVDANGDVASEAICPIVTSRPSQPDRDPAMATIGPLVEAEIPFLQRVVRRWYRDAADADDLMQDTLLRALASAHLWQPGTNLRAWLVTIMRNQFLETVGRARRWDAV